MPPKQAGYSIYVEDRIGTAHIIVSQDFKSAIATPFLPFQGARPIRSAGTQSLSLDFNDSEMEQTGSVDDLLHPNIRERGENNANIESSSTDPDEAYDIDEIIDHKRIRGGHYRFRVRWAETDELTWEPDKYLAQDVPNIFAEYLHRSGLNKLKRFNWAKSYGTTDNDSITSSKSQDTDPPEIEEEEHTDPEEFQQPIQSSNRYDLRPRACLTYESLDNAFDTEPDPTHTAFSLISKGTKTQPVSLFLPEPQSFKAILSQPPELRDLWLASLRSEIMNLLNNDTFVIEKPRKGEQVVPTRPVPKAKSNSDGTLDKLKIRIVVRGDLQKSNEWEDTWSACAAIRTVKMFLALATSMKRRVKQGDFVGAYLQAKARNRIFVKLDPRYKEYFPDLAKWFGVPLRLKKCMYGVTFSGKFWSLELSDWFKSEGFIRSTADTTYHIKYFDDGSWVRVISYVDDVLYFGSNDKAEKQFEEAVAKKFRIDLNGQAH